ncbi:peptidylprolyl isomerase [Allosphingosinicella vermicomposti]|uniref:peptidylprolyl isomerase n=1 Tax=Allosphingosinicella vermicomposti TaxID=614671 RepID=UPI000D1141D1|nr:peptidylprolyl isomerase [Allosphingosinicella vermicomposti]
MRLSLILAGLACAAPGSAEPAHQTPAEVIAAAPAAEWRAIDPADLLVIDFADGGRSIIQLAPSFAPVHVANIRALAKSGYWAKGAAIYRVQDNYVTQWGLNEAQVPLPAGVVKLPPAEYLRDLTGEAASDRGVKLAPFADSYADKAGFLENWPVAVHASGKSVSIPHCYAYVGVARDLAPDTGMGGELYAVIGHAPRQLDRNIAIVGRVVDGMDRLSARPRGQGALGIYDNRASDIPIASVRLASDISVADRPAYEMMDQASPSFARYLHLRANRRDAFYEMPAGGVDICNAPVPIRKKAS